MSHKITTKLFKKATGDKPRLDDLERSNCKQAGKPGHNMCGWNYEKNGPVFMVGKEDKKDGE